MPPHSELRVIKSVIALIEASFGEDDPGRLKGIESLKLPLILSVEALSPPLSGIGRYALELASRLPMNEGVESIRYFHQGRWIIDPTDLLNPAFHPLQKTWLQKREPMWLRDQRLKRQCRDRLFHGPNYFLPACAGNGVATIHDLSAFRFPETHPVERIKQFETNFTTTLARAAHLITDTEAIRREVISHFSWPEKQITAIPLGVGNRYRPHEKHETTEVLAGHGLCHGEYSLCVATIEPRKNIDLLLDAYHELPPILRKLFPLVLVGNEGWQSEKLHSRIEACCIEGWLRYLKFVPEADLPMLYAGARLFVYPSQYEGFGLPVLEAMASGVPVITSLDPALVEVSGGTTLTVSSDDSEALRQAVLKGLEDDSWRDEALVSGLQRASQFTWERCVDQTVQVYQRLA